MSLNRIKRWFGIAWKANESFYTNLWEDLLRVNTSDLLTTGQDIITDDTSTVINNRITE